MKICYIRYNDSPTLYERAIEEVYKCGNKKAIKVLTTAICLLMNCGYAFAAEAAQAAEKVAEKEAADPFKVLGNGAISYLQYGITIIAVIMALFETGKALLEGDPKRIPSIVAKYGIGVICVYLIPYTFFKISGAFKDWKVM